MIYWTKRIISEDGFPTNELELIKQDKDIDYVPDGDGFAINMNGIEYEDYISNPDKFEIDGYTLKEK